MQSFISPWPHTLYASRKKKTKHVRGGTVCGQRLSPLQWLCFKCSCKSDLLWPFLGELRTGQRVKSVTSPCWVCTSRPGKPEGRLEEGVHAAEGEREGVRGGRVKQKEKNKLCTPRNKTGEQVQKKSSSLKNRNFSVCFPPCSYILLSELNVQEIYESLNCELVRRIAKASQYNFSWAAGKARALSFCASAMGGHLMLQHTAVQTSFLLYTNGLLKQSRTKAVFSEW